MYYKKKRKQKSPGVLNQDFGMLSLPESAIQKYENTLSQYPGESSLTHHGKYKVFKILFVDETFFPPGRDQGNHSGMI